jgi:two-component system KDP operon response regulator KdpE
MGIEVSKTMKVLVIDDDRDVAQVVSLCLGMRWPKSTVVSAVDGAEGISLAKAESPDVIILDFDLSNSNGLEVCSEIRNSSDVPIVILGTTTTDIDISRALETGADDYIAKPFSPIELLSRVQAVMRRAQKLPLSKGEGIFYSSKLIVDFDNREVRVNGELVKLTPHEYGLLYHLARNAGRVQTYESLLAKIWGEDYKHEKDLLKLPIRTPRRKVGDNPRNPCMIVNEQLVGYRFVRID